MNDYRELDQAYSLLKEAQGLIKSLTGERDSLRREKSQLINKIAESVNMFKYAQIVDEMVEGGIVDLASKSEKINEMVDSGLSPDVYKEAMNLAPTLYSLGHLDNASEVNSNEGNPLEKAILSFVQHKN